MKIKSLILAMAACAGLFSACNNDIITDENGNGQDSEKNAYASFSFVMPASSSSTRADNPLGGPNGNGSEVGTQDENEITNVSILLFDATSKLVQIEELKRTDFTPTTTGNVIVYRTIKDIEVKTGAYKVQVVVNPTKTFKKAYDKTSDAGIGTTYDKYLTTVEQVAAATGEYCTDRSFMMTNADEVAATTTTVTEDNVVGHAKEVSVNVERIAAKITFESNNSPQSNNTYPIKNVNDIDETIGSVTFDAYKVINTRNSAFNLRRAGLTEADAVAGAKETGANYIIENKWADKASWSKDVFNANYSRRGVDTYVAFRKIEGNKQTLAYCLENTMLQNMQIEGYTTTVVLRAKTSLNAGKVTSLNEKGEIITNAAAFTGTLYKYAGKFYTSRVAIVKVENPDWDLATLKGLNTNTLGLKTALEALPEGTPADKTAVENHLNGLTAAQLNDIYGVEYYANGNCYYKVLLRHANNNDPVNSGIMEFGIVRNNVYKLSITSVKFLGSFSSGTKGPEDPKNPGDGQVDVPDTGENPEIPGTVVDPEEPGEPETPVITPDPENPDETDETTYLNVTIKVLDWTVRTNNVEL